MPCKAVQRKVTDELGKYKSTPSVLEQTPVTLTIKLVSTYSFLPLTTVFSC